MIVDLKRYPATKDSGVPWIGDVPEHWQVKKLRHCGVVFGGMTPSMENRRFWDGAIPWVTPKDMKREIIRDSSIRVAEAAVLETPLRLLDAPVILLVVRGMILARRVPIAVTAAQVTVNQDMKALKPSAGINAAFLARSLDSAQPAFVPLIDEAGHGTRRLPTERWREIEVAIPPEPEQLDIVRFLDHADHRIRRYIHAKQRLIKLLEEQKQAIIHRAVTRGLDPNVRLKPSGVEWLGDVPDHWEIWQVGHLAAVGNGSTPSRGNLAYWSGGTYPWLNSSSVHAGTITASDQFVTNTALRECHLPRVAAGSVLVAITGQGKTRATAAVLAIEATINQHIAFITPRKNSRATTAAYLRAVLMAAYSELRRMSDDSGSTKGALTCADLRHFRVALPPLEEQERILKSSSAAIAEVEHALRLASREIALLREYRTRLIADVVTGKLDVREAAVRLPDEEPELLDEPDVDAEVEELDAGDADEAMEVVDA